MSLSLRILCLMGLLTTASVTCYPQVIVEPWISHYGGSVSSEREEAEMDNFAIQISNDANLIGYILIYGGADSCRGEAQARALRIRKYLMNVRGVPWNRVMWKDVGATDTKVWKSFFLGSIVQSLVRPNFLTNRPRQDTSFRSVVRNVAAARNRCGETCVKSRRPVNSDVICLSS